MPNRLHTHSVGSAALLARLSNLKGTHIAEYLDRAKSETRIPMDQQTGLANVVEHPNPLHTQQHQFERAASLGERLKRSGTQMINEALEDLAAGHSFLNVLANNRLKLATETKYQPLILQKYAPKERGEIFIAMNTAMKENDWETFGALFNAPTSLTGLTAEDKQRLRADYIALHAPDIAADFKVLDEAGEHILAIDRSIQMSAYDVADPRRLAEVRAGIEAAEAAEKSFGEPLPPAP